MLVATGDSNESTGCRRVEEEAPTEEGVEVAEEAAADEEGAEAAKKEGDEETPAGDS